MAEITPATLGDIDYICHLQRIEANRQDSIGFLPRIAYEKEVVSRGRGLLLIGRENDDEVGFIYATRNTSGITRIQQVSVQDDARRLEIGTVLVDAVTDPNDWLMTLRCRENLPSVGFWKDLGFTVESIDETPTVRKQRVLGFQKVIGGLWKGG